MKSEIIDRPSGNDSFVRMPEGVWGIYTKIIIGVLLRNIINSIFNQ